MLCRIAFASVLLGGGLCYLAWADDCGLHGYDGTQIVQFDCQDAITFAASPSPLQIHTPPTPSNPQGDIRGITLVDPSTPGASKFRVRYKDTVSGNDKIMALGRVPITISSCEELQMIGFHPAYPANGVYQLGSDIDCSATYYGSPTYATSLWGLGYAARFPYGFDGIPDTADDNLPALSSVALGASGFLPIPSTLYGTFSGTLDGRGKVVSNLFINRPTENYVGLFRDISTGTQIKDLGLVNITLWGSGSSVTGSLAGNNHGNIIHSYATGSVSGVGGVGGLVGLNYGSISDSYAAVDVKGSRDRVGGLVGGGQLGSIIVRSYATGRVDGTSPGYYGGTGGLAGGGCGSLADSYAIGSVNGGDYVGGLVGYMQDGDSITNSSATGSVNGSHYVGGLVGIMWAGSITNSFSTGIATSYGTTPGGLLGNGSGILTNNWWYNGTNTGGVGIGGPLAGVSKADAMNNFYDTGSVTGGAVYANSAPTGQPTNAWDFTNTWRSVAGALPHLKWEQ